MTDMDEAKPDWADDLADKLLGEYSSLAVADAFRKVARQSKAGGMREAARLIDMQVDYSQHLRRPLGSLHNPTSVALRVLADEIESGQSAAQKLQSSTE